MKKILIFLLGLLALGVLGYACLYSKASDIQYEISQSVQGNLADERFENVKASVDGRNILLKGMVESEDLKKQAEEVSSVEGYHSIDNQISTTNKLSNTLSKQYELSLTKSSLGDIVLKGDIPDSTSRHHLVVQAMEMFGIKRVQDKLKVSKEMPLVQAESLVGLLMPLEVLESGEILFNNDGVSIVGSVDSQEKKDQLSRISQRAVDSAPDKRQYSQQISIIDNQPKKQQLPVVKTESSCQKDFDSLLSKTKINFQPSTFTIEESSYALLGDLLAVVEKCNTHQLTIRGHTDSTGTESLNKKISEQRANAVMAYFINQGVESNRLTALGMGESEPIADNRVAKGRAFNRRIDFIVEKEK